MKSFLKAIILFNDVGEKREIDLVEGINIITGRSKTGKSALVEIIDYCLCSRRSTIPKGKITEFTYLYVIALAIENKTYIIARQSWNNAGKMCLVKEDENFDVKSLSLQYFDDKNFMPRLAVQNEIETALGLDVSNISTNEEGGTKKASLRNMVSYLFQHQNLIASKFALFYRFSDYYKRKDVIEQFPVFAGIISQEYYSDLIRLNDLRNQLKLQLKKQKEVEKRSKFVKENIHILLRDYYALLNISNDITDLDLPLSELKNIARCIPEFDASQYLDGEQISGRYNNLKKQLETLREQETELKNKISNLKDYSDDGESFSAMLNNLSEETSASPITVQNYVCPLCGQSCEELVEKDEQIKQSAEWLNNELKVAQKYKSEFSEEIRIFENQRENVVNQIKKIWKQIKEIEDKYISSKNLKTKIDQINYAKAKIGVFVDMCDKEIFIDDDIEIKDLEEKVKYYEEKIKGFDVESKKAKAEVFIADNMNRLAKFLDFEEEYKPINLNFGLLDSSFDVYQQHKTETIHLDEMGSGANWVSCHIALFLSFLHYFARQENSPMPLIMFFDQPSQVYFPQGDSGRKRTSADIAAVNSMYKAIFDEIKNIENEVGFKPQLIIVDHVDGDDLEIKQEFNQHVRYNWLREGALI
ncbi:MAG: DUF3732 domain-containing protein [Clostridiales bacterium]|nr:DUF3732 domain-containing protein [Clostridiales bacterium]